MMKKTLYFEQIHILKKGTWSPDEDQKLRAYINRYGIWNWNEMPKAAGLSRSGKSCRLRWMNYLRPNIRHGNFTKEEEETIFKLHEMLGNRWSAIASRLPGRTDNDIKNYWNTYIRKRLKNKTKLTKPVRSYEGNYNGSPCNVPKALEPESSDEMPIPTPSSNIVQGIDRNLNQAFGENYIKQTWFEGSEYSYSSSDDLFSVLRSVQIPEDSSFDVQSLLEQQYIPLEGFNEASNIQEILWNENLPLWSEEQLQSCPMMEYTIDDDGTIYTYPMHQA